MKKLFLILAILSLTISSFSQKGQFSNPSNIYGSSYGTFFISMLRTQNYDMALKFTSKESIKKFGVDKIKQKYQDFNFNYKLVQKSMTTSGGKTTIVYVTNEMATGKIKTMTLIVENDSCKIVLPNNLAEFLK
jgi:hypothetical protein